MLQVLESQQTGGNGEWGRKAEQLIGKLLGEKCFPLLMTSATSALEVALMILGVGPGDEVICPSFTYVSTANAIARLGARPVFAEIDKRTLNIDPDDISRRITGKTKAIIPVHYAGIGCGMSEIESVAKDSHVQVIEDAAHGIGASYRAQPLGTIGKIGCFSFHQTKNISCGEGGCLVTGDEEVARRADIVREKGTNRSAFLRGEIPYYSWIDIGSSFVLSDLLAAVLYQQLLKLEEVTRRRREIFFFYRESLAELEQQGKIILPYLPPECELNGHIFWFRVEGREKRDTILDYLKENSIGSTSHYPPLHLTPFGREKLGYQDGDFPLTEMVSDTIVRLPVYPQLTREELDHVIEVVCQSIGV